MKPVLFIDFDGTLCHDRFWRSLPSSLYTQVQKLFFEEDTSRIQSWMKGEVTSEEINDFLSAQLAIPKEELWQLFVRDCETMHIPTSVLEKIASLRKRFHVVLLTTNMDCFSRFTVPALHLDDYFDSISNSCYEGKFKTENGGEIYLEHAIKYSVPIDQCIVVDDSDSVCKMFRALGGRALRVTPEQDIFFQLEQI